MYATYNAKRAATCMILLVSQLKNAILLNSFCMKSNVDNVSSQLSYFAVKFYQQKVRICLLHCSTFGQGRVIILCVYLVVDEDVR